MISTFNMRPMKSEANKSAIFVRFFLVRSCYMKRIYYGESSFSTGPFCHERQRNCTPKRASGRQEGSVNDLGRGSGETCFFCNRHLAATNSLGDNCASILFGFLIRITILITKLNVSLNVFFVVHLDYSSHSHSPILKTRPATYLATSVPDIICAILILFTLQEYYRI